MKTQNDCFVTPKGECTLGERVWHIHNPNLKQETIPNDSILNYRFQERKDGQREFQVKHNEHWYGAEPRNFVFLPLIGGE